MRYRRHAPYLLTLLAFLGVGIALSARREREAARRIPPKGRLVPVEGGCVHVVADGPSGGVPVIALHGADGASNGFIATIAEDLARWARFIALDRPGHGWSVVEPPSSGHDVAFNVAVARQAVAPFVGGRRAVLVGHSYGAATALRWALDHPDEVSALVLISPAAFDTWPRALKYATYLPRIPLIGPLLTWALLPILGPAVLRFTSRHVGFRGERVPPEFREYSHLLYLRGSEFFALIEEYRTIGRDLHEMAPRYSELEIPVWVIAAAGDPLTTLKDQSERLARAVPSAKLIVVPGSAHELQWGSSAVVVDAVREAMAVAVR